MTRKKKLLFNPDPPSMWRDVVSFACPDCGHEFTLDQLELERKFSDYYSAELYYAKCPECDKEHVIFG